MDIAAQNGLRKCEPMARYYNDFNDTRGSDELFHYGVQGMKWGIRKYVNYDGSLTAEGRRKYGSYQNFARSSEGQKNAFRSKNQNGVQSQKKSDHRLKLEAKYQKQGKSKEEAEAAAEKRIKTEKIIAASAGVALTSVAAVALIKKYKDYADDIVVGTKDKPIYRMEMMNEAKDHDASKAIFGFYNKKDAPLYNGLWATQQSSVEEIRNALRGSEDKLRLSPHEMKITYNSGVKIASDKNARKTFKDLMKNDSTFRKKVEDMVGENELNLVRDKYGRFIYKMTGEGRESDAAKQFFNKLAEKGYGGIHDINDTKRSHYGKSAAIFFKDGYDWSAKKLSSKEVEDSAKIGAKMFFKNKFKDDLKNVVLPVALSSGAPIAGSAAIISRTKGVRAISMKQAGVSVSDIAKQLHISESEVYKLLGKNGVKTQQNQQPRKKIPTKEQTKIRSEVVSRILLGSTGYTIAKRIRDTR